MAWDLVPKLAIIFRHLVRGGSFGACWGFADVVPVSKESSSSDDGDNKSIYIPPGL